MVCRWVKIKKNWLTHVKQKEKEKPLFQAQNNQILTIFAQKQDNLTIEKTAKNFNFNYTNHVSNNSFLFFLLTKPQFQAFQKTKLKISKFLTSKILK